MITPRSNNYRFRVSGKAIFGRLRLKMLIHGYSVGP